MEIRVLKLYRPTLVSHLAILFKVAQNSFLLFPRLLMGHYNHSLSVDTTIMVSKNCLITGEHVVIIFVTQ